MGHEGHHHHEHDEHDGVHAHAHEEESGHGHGHVHVHGEEAAHAHGKARWREDLKRGVGEGKILFLDAAAGLAGDMIIAALVDLGVPPQVVADAAAAVPIAGYHLHFGSKVRSGIVASYFDVHVDAAQPERKYAEIKEIVAGATLPDAVRERAQRAFLRLAESESKVHQSSLEDVHFHEVGAIDAIVDIVGSAAALEYLGAEMIVSPLPMGRGFVRARHGVLPLPAPATVECLRGFPTYDAGIDAELVTPTGAAIVAANARSSSRWPSMRPEHVGWGSGARTLADRPNLLRAVLGADNRVAAHGRAGEHDEYTHAVIETNVDDATGELVGATIDVLLASGAVDAWAQPITMKKGRPAFTLSALCPMARADELAAVMLRETTSIGVRRFGVSRVERPREVRQVATAYGAIPVKVSGGPFGPAQIKPEFDACLAAAKAHAVPVREVIRAAIAAASSHGGNAP